MNRERVVELLYLGLRQIPVAGLARLLGHIEAGREILLTGEVAEAGLG